MSNAFFNFFGLPREVRKRVYIASVDLEAVALKIDYGGGLSQKCPLRFQLVSKQFSEEYGVTSADYATPHHYMGLAVDPGVALPPPSVQLSHPHAVFHLSLSVSYDAEAREVDGWRTYTRRFIDYPFSFPWIRSMQHLTHVAFEIETTAVNNALVAWKGRLDFIEDLEVALHQQLDRLPRLLEWSIRSHYCTGLWDYREPGGQWEGEGIILRRGQDAEEAKKHEALLASLGIREGYLKTYKSPIGFGLKLSAGMSEKVWMGMPVDEEMGLCSWNVRLIDSLRVTHQVSGAENDSEDRRRKDLQRYRTQGFVEDDEFLYEEEDEGHLEYVQNKKALKAYLRDKADGAFYN